MGVKALLLWSHRGLVSSPLFGGENARTEGLDQGARASAMRRGVRVRSRGWRGSGCMARRSVAVAVGGGGRRGEGELCPQLLA